MASILTLHYAFTSVVSSNPSQSEPTRIRVTEVPEIFVPSVPENVSVRVLEYYSISLISIQYFNPRAEYKNVLF